MSGSVGASGILSPGPALHPLGQWQSWEEAPSRVREACRAHMPAPPGFLDVPSLAALLARGQAHVARR